MPPQKQKTKETTSAIAGRDQWADPFADLGEASSQLQLKIPVVKIEYLASKDTQRTYPDFKPGLFSLSFGEQLDHLEIGLIGLRYGRVCFLSDFDPENPNAEPDCKSDNGIFPASSLEKPLTDQFCNINGEKIPVCVHCDDNAVPSRNRAGKYIVACPFARWSDRKSAPKCHDFFTLLLWEHQLNLPLIYTVKGTGIKHLNQLHMDMIRAVRLIPETSKYPASAYIKIRIHSIPVSRWYEPQFKIDKPFSDDQAFFNAQAKIDLVDAFHSMNSDDFAFDKAEEDN